MNIYKEIEEFQKSLQSQIEGSVIDVERDFEVFKSLTISLLKVSESKEDFEKSWSTDLQKKFPNGVWRKINGASVFINNGKVVAGLDGFNGMIDDFFSKKKEESGKKEDSLERVKHPTFGEGTVIEQDDNNITIEFDEHGRKKLLKRFANLTTENGDTLFNTQKDVSVRKIEKIKPTQPTNNKGLEEQIKELKDNRTLAEIKEKDKKTYYKIKSLTEKLSDEKAREKGNFITKEHLTEYKPLIIWALKNKANYKGYLNLKESMQDLLDDVEKEKPIYKTEKSIKNSIVRMAILAGLSNSEKNLRESKGYSVATNTMGHKDLEDFTQFRLNALMNL